MKIGETLKGVQRELEDAGVESPGAEAEILVAAATGLLDLPRADLYRSPDRELTRAEARTLARLVLRRVEGEPVQYVVRRAWFRDLALEVGPGVLVPRSETELLAGEVLDWMARKRSHVAHLRVLDLGTGSGCLALALAAESAGAHVLGTDVSMDALAYAHRNRDRLAASSPRAAARVGFVAGDLFAPLRSRPLFDVIVSNPPYVDRSERESLPREVREHEPEVALFPPGSGTAVLQAIVEQAAHFLVPGGLLALEIGETQADNVRGWIGKAGAYEPVRTVRDLAGRTRLVLAELSPGP